MEKSTPGEYRLIHNLSFPAGQSINDGIPRDFCRVEYARFDDAVALVRTAGEGALMAKSDIKSAFRLLPIAPEDFELLGFNAAVNGKLKLTLLKVVKDSTPFRRRILRCKNFGNGESSPSLFLDVVSLYLLKFRER